MTKVARAFLVGHRHGQVNGDIKRLIEEPPLSSLQIFLTVLYQWDIITKFIITLSNSQKEKPKSKSKGKPEKTKKKAKKESDEESGDEEEESEEEDADISGGSDSDWNWELWKRLDSRTTSNKVHESSFVQTTFKRGIMVTWLKSLVYMSKGCHLEGQLGFKWPYRLY